MIEIHTACYPFAELVTPIPVDCFRSRFVHRCGFITHIYASYNPSGCIVDSQVDDSIFCQPIRYPCLWVEWIGIVSQQFRLRWYFVDCQFWQLNLALPHIFSGDGIPQRLYTDSWVWDSHGDFKDIPNPRRSACFRINDGELIANPLISCYSRERRSAFRTDCSAG